MDEAWTILTDKEQNEIWDRFYKDFSFRPSTAKRDFPGISEPTPSVTFDISNIYCDKAFALNKNLQENFLKVFQNITNNDDWIYALEWQSSCYKFFPHKPFDLVCHYEGCSEPMEWIIPILPDGDYYIFLTQDLKSGVFGHPWEKTMCIFGENLLQELNQNMPKIFGKPIREKS